MTFPGNIFHRNGRGTMKTIQNKNFISNTIVHGRCRLVYNDKIRDDLEALAKKN